MKNNKTKAIIIDIALLYLLALLLMIGIYTIYNLFPSLPRIITVLIIVFMIPLVWTTIICSILGKKTIGNRIVEKKK